MECIGGKNVNRFYTQQNALLRIKGKKRNFQYQISTNTKRVCDHLTLSKENSQGMLQAGRK